MKRPFFALVCALVFILALCGIALAAGDCMHCGMDLASYQKSRMTVTFDDGRVLELCSIHCAALELRANSGHSVRSVTVADYDTGRMTDARAASWVIGGNLRGVMSPVGKWAFASADDAKKFATEHGGRVATYDEALVASLAEVEEGGGPAPMRHGPPMPAFGDDIYHPHPAGMWMVGYQFMHMEMSGFMDGDSYVGRHRLGFKRGSDYEEMMIPTNMDMDMHMAMVMYGVTDRLTLMAMAQYVGNRMDMLMDMGPMMTPTPVRQDPMSTNGMGDTELRGIVKITDAFTGSLGVSIPTGSIDRKVEMMGMYMRAPYDMQLGTGTYDLSPSLTYAGGTADGKWGWGGQASYKYHIGKNENGWAYGDSLKLQGWLARVFGPFSSWARLAYTDTDRIRGHDRQVDRMLDPASMAYMPEPDADPGHYGGQSVDGALGLSYSVGKFTVGLEAGAPLYQYVNDLQMKQVWRLSTGVSMMF